MGREARARKKRKADSQRVSELEQQLAEKDQKIAGLQQLVALAEEQGKIQVVTGNKDAQVGITPLYSEEWAATYAARKIQEYRSYVLNDLADIIDFMVLFGGFQTLMQRIDAIAVYATNTQLPSALEGLDKQLAATFLDVRKYLLGPMKSPDQEQMLARLVNARIEGIRLVKQDNGEQLRRVVAETNMLFADMSEQVIKRARQGRRKSPTISRIVEYAEQLRADPHMTWNDAARDLKKQLEQRQRGGEQLDSVDTDILKELQARYASGSIEAMGRWLKNAVHTRKRAG